MPEEHTETAWREWFDRFGARTALGVHDVRLVTVDDEKLVLEMEIGDHARQPYGLLHGGMSMLLAESAASLHACWKINLAEKIPVGIEINGSHLNAARSGTVRAIARQIRRSSRLAHHEIEIRSTTPDRLLSTVRMTNFYTAP